MCFLCLFVSFAILFLLVFPSLLAPLISSPLLFPCGGLGLLVPELMVLCCLLSPLLFLHSSLAVILSSLVLCWAYVTFGARAPVVLPHFQFVFAFVIIGSCFYVLCLFAYIAGFGPLLHVSYSSSLVHCENPHLVLR